MIRAKSAGEKLRRQHLQALLSREHARLHDEVLNRRGRVATSSDTSGGIDDFLELINGGVRRVGRPDGGGVEEGGFDVRLVGADDGFL